MGLNKGYLTARTDKESDEVYTPAYAVQPLIKHIEEFAWRCHNDKDVPLTIWCPFDNKDSAYVEELSKLSYVNVIYSHIDEGQNFFEYEPEEYDLIISNPPFSIKDMILKRLYELNKPYALLFPLPTLQGQARHKYLEDTQILVFDKRINFYKNKETKEIQKGISFATIYICKDFLKHDYIREELEI